MELKEAYEKAIAEYEAAGGKWVVPVFAAFCGNCGRQPWDCRCLKSDPEETPKMGDFEDLKFDDSDLSPAGRFARAKEVEETPPIDRVRGRLRELAAGVGGGKQACYFCGRKGLELAEVKSIRAFICGGCAMEHLS